MTDLWAKPIAAGGATATPGQMQRAWDEWVQGDLRTALALERALDRAGAFGADRPWPFGRLAGRMLQRARRAGVIRYVKGRWEDAGPHGGAEKPSSQRPWPNGYGQ